MRRYLALAALCALTTPAAAGELVPYGGESIELGSVRGIAYYTEAPSGYRVITTIADGEAGLPVRFEATLADNQKLTISVPGKLGEPSQALEIVRAGDKLVIFNPRPGGDEFVVARPLAPGN